ncbi:MAG: hypothetical protein O3C29_06785 [Proteobacteria bacterium]|nr:hypothetical protein [Pseudomonadota bacterium]MDA1290102.1 hypothetical protein [Pseudomonadota bacterium]
MERTTHCIDLSESYLLELARRGADDLSIDDSSEGLEHICIVTDLG